MSAMLQSDEFPWEELIADQGLAPTNIVLTANTGRAERVAKLVNLMLISTVDSGEAAFSQVCVLLPPDVPDTIHQDVMNDMARRHGGSDEVHAQAVSGRLHVHRVTSLNAAELVALITDLPDGSFAIVLDASRYRAPDAASISSSFGLPEDRWIPSLIWLADACIERSSAPRCVLIDAGASPPQLERNIDAFRDLDCLVWAVGGQAAVADDEILRFKRWVARVKRGDVLTVLDEVDVLEATSNQSKLIMKADLLHKGGRSSRAAELLQPLWASAERLAPFVGIRLAAIAVAGGDRVGAAVFLNGCAAKLDDPQMMEDALDLAQTLQSETVTRHCLSWLARYQPDSAALQEHQLQAMLVACRDGGTIQCNDIAGLPLTAYVDLILASVHRQEVPDYSATISGLGTEWEHLHSETVLACALDAMRRDLPVQAAMLVVGLSPVAGRVSASSQLLLWTIERLLIAGQGDHRELISDAVLWALRYLAAHPADTQVRERLDELLSIDSAGVNGIALLAHAVLRLIDIQQVSETSLHRPSVPAGAWQDEEWLGFYRSATEWITQDGVVDLATVRLPIELLTLSADEVLAKLKVLAQYVVEQEQPDDYAVLNQMLMIAFAVVPHADNSSADLELLRLVATRLVITGQAQLARDLVESGLSATHDDPHRLRLAWHAYGDVFHRMQDHPRALLSFGCAVASGGDIGLEQAYYESVALARALRDIGLFDVAHALLARCEGLISRMGAGEDMAHRLQTLRLGVRLGELHSLRAELGHWIPLLSELSANLREVMRRDDEITTVLLLLVQSRDRVLLLGGEVPSSVDEIIQQASAMAGAITQDLLLLAENAAPGRDRLVSYAQLAQRARYSGDVGFDVQRLVRAARAQLAQEETLADAELAAFAVEATSDHAILVPGAVGQRWLPSTLDEPAETINLLSQQGLQVELLALDSADRLIRVSGVDGRILVNREDGVFSARGLDAWSIVYPYAFGIDSDDPNLFHTSMRELGLSSSIGARTVFVMDTRLQSIPPQLLVVEGEFVGNQASIAVAPSLAWLRGATTSSPLQYGPPAAWISTAVSDGEDGTLCRVADRLNETFVQHQIQLNTGAEPPPSLRAAQLAIVAAHGGLDPGARFFQVVSDESALRISSLDLARALERVGVAILFVCSGGRQNAHPAANTTVGLPKQLLSRGTRAVIASPWPLDSRVPSHWLPAFLHAWNEGARLIDANADANRAVARQMGHEPRDALAMTLYGNPLLCKGDLPLSE
jgi:hypothetical protein